jgi:hypothetical protein
LPSTRDRPLVVLAEEDHRRVVRRREDERLVHVALRGGAVAEERHHAGVALGITGADQAVALDAHRVAGRVQRLGADDDRVVAEVVLGRVPGALVDAAEQAEDPQRVEPAAEGHPVLAIGREDEVLGSQRPAAADLGGLLAEQLRPDAELAVALERGRLGVDPAGQHHVPVEAPDHRSLVGVADVEDVLRVLDPFTLGREELDEATIRVGGIDGTHDVSW